MKRSSSHSNKPIMLYLHENTPEYSGDGTPLLVNVGSLDNWGDLLDDCMARLKMHKYAERLFTPNGTLLNGFDDIVPKMQLIVVAEKENFCVESMPMDPESEEEPAPVPAPAPAPAPAPEPAASVAAPRGGRVLTGPPRSSGSAPAPAPAPAPAVEEGVPQSKAEAAFAKYSFVENSPSGNELRAMDSAGERRRISRRPHSHHPLSLA